MSRWVLADGLPQVLWGIDFVKIAELLLQERLIG
jgi:hypothetical protein